MLDRQWFKQRAKSVCSGDSDIPREAGKDGRAARGWSGERTCGSVVGRSGARSV